MGFNPRDANFCTRHAFVMHDVFIEKIAQWAPLIRSPSDLYSILYLWKYVDSLGPEIFHLITRAHPAAAPEKTASSDSPSRKRIRCA